MTDGTQEKILDAALKTFAEKGYVGATTTNIAEKAGFSQMTLFRKFETKKNLFDKVLIKNFKAFKRDFESILKDDESSNTEDFLETLIRNLAKLADKKFELIHLLSNEKTRVTEPFMAEFINHLSKHIENNVQNDKIDFNAFAASIFAIIYLISLSNHQGTAFIDSEEILDKFIDNSVLLIQK